MTVLEHLSEALRLDRLERASSPVSMHIVNALSTFGVAGQNEVRKANAARLSRVPVAKSSGEPKQWNPGKPVPGKPTGLPVSEVIESPLKPATQQALPASKQQPSKATTEKPAPAAPQSEKRSAQVAGIESGITSGDGHITITGAIDVTDMIAPSLANAKRGEIPNRPSKVLEKYGIEQVRGYLERAGVEIKDGASEREIAALLIQKFKPV